MIRYSDEELIDLLVELDENDDISVTSWEASFIDNIFKNQNALTEKQRDKIEELLDKYE